MAQSPGSQMEGRFAWVSRDARIIISARGLRTLAQASIAVLIGIYLDLLGFSLVQIGLFVSLGLAGSAFFATLITLFGNTFGRRRLLTVFTLFTGAAGATLAFTDQYVLLAVVVFLGSFNAAGGNASGPVQPLEHATLPETVSAENRTAIFTLYGIVSTATRAVGSLAAGLPTVFQTVFAMDELLSYRVMFGAFAVLAALTALMYLRLSPAVEGAKVERRWTNPFTLPSRRRIFLIAGLLSTDTFAVRLVAQSLVSLWFYTRFDMEVALIAVLFFVTDLLHSLSMWVSLRIAKRIGLLNAIILTHIPAVLFVAALPFMPTAALAAALWLVRGFFSQMDGPLRQSYMMGIVSSEERTAFAGLNNMGQNITGSVSPSVAALLWSSVWVGMPFVGSAVVKAVYLVAFFSLFRDVRPPEEEREAHRNRE